MTQWLDPLDGPEDGWKQDMPELGDDTDVEYARTMMRLFHEANPDRPFYEDTADALESDNDDDGEPLRSYREYNPDEPRDEHGQWTSGGSVNSPAGKKLMARVRAFATEAHKGQKDKGGADYITHPERVSKTVEHLGVDFAATGLLHDVVEDTPRTHADIAKLGVSPRVQAAVKLMTHPEGEPYATYVKRVASNPIAAAVKRSDIKDNSNPKRQRVLPQATRDRLRAKYAEAIKILDQNQPEMSAMHHSVKLLHETVGAKGGFSYHASTGVRPHDGWMVAVPGSELEIPVKDFTAQHIKDYVAAHRAELSIPKVYLGGWYNRDNGHVYLDISSNIQNTSRAVHVGNERDQFGIFNVRTHEYRALNKDQSAARFFDEAKMRGMWGTRSDDSGPVEIGEGDGSMHHIILDKDDVDSSYADVQAMIRIAEKDA